MAAIDAGVLPMIKCSSCGEGVEISAMGDHVCAHDRMASPMPPAPPPKSDYQVTTSPPAGYTWETRQKPLPRIDPSIANRPFMRPEEESPSKKSAVLSSPQQSQTTPAESSSPTWENGIPSFPLPRSMSNRRPAAYADMKPLGTAPLPSMRRSPYEVDQGPMTAQPDFNRELPPPPLPKDEDAPLPDIQHRRNESFDSKSSYGTASFNGSKRSTMISGRRPSFGSVPDPQAFLDDGPSRPAPLETLSEIPSHQESSGLGAPEQKEEDARYSSFDFGIPTERSNRDVVIAPGDRLDVSFIPDNQSIRESGDFFLGSHSPKHSVDKPLPSPGRMPSTESLASNGYNFRKPSGSSHYLHPGSIDGTNQRRKNSDASEGGNSVSNFARALGLEDGEHRSNESSAASSDFSPSESRSGGTSLSSLPSETSFSRRKASEASRLGPVVEEHNSNPPPQPQSQDSLSPTARSPMVVDGNSDTNNPTNLELPKIHNIFPSPDSPTDPAISTGSLALISEHSPRSAHSGSSSECRSPVSPAKERPTGTIFPPTPRLAARPKGRCRGCGEAIIGKSVSSADGRLTGRYHKECFACCYCRIQFQTADFYVLNDRPYCAQHYHELNGSLCSTCNQGIEGQYLETDERQGRGPGDRRKFHPECLTCRTCNLVLKYEYFEFNGGVYCERDARRAAASMPPPPRFRRPTIPCSHMAPRPPYGPGPPGPMGRPPFPPPGPGRRPPPPMMMPPDGLVPPGYGPGPYGPPSPGAMRRFPERRTTRLMMI